MKIDSKFETHDFVFEANKPDEGTIDEMIGKYYNEIGMEYETNLFLAEKRLKYTKALASLTADCIVKYQPRDILSIGAGSGFTDELIQNSIFSSHAYSLTLLEPNYEMYKVFRNRGFQGFCVKFEDFKVTNQYDFIYCLWTFGHCSSRQRRVGWLEKINKLLLTNGFLTFDCLNLYDENEWGPKIRTFYHEFGLSEKGYEPGDVFYKVNNGKNISFFHYFSKNEIIDLLEETGFRPIDFFYIGYGASYGEILTQSQNGAIYVVAQKI